MNNNKQSSQVSRVERESHALHADTSIPYAFALFRQGTLPFKLSEVLMNSEIVPSLALNFGLMASVPTVPLCPLLLHAQRSSAFLCVYCSSMPTVPLCPLFPSPVPNVPLCPLLLYDVTGASYTAHTPNFGQSSICSCATSFLVYSGLPLVNCVLEVRENAS